VSPAPRARSLPFDLDAPALRPLDLGNPHAEDAPVEVRLDLLGIDLLGQPHPVLEATDPSRSPAEDAFPLALLDLAGDRKLVPDHLDVYVLALDPGELRFDHVRVVLLLDVDRR
jgi:hypothetical protein